MSKISTAYDDIISELDTLFPNKTRLFNSYSITDNPVHIVRDGYGLRYLGANLSGDSEYCKSFNDEHLFEVVFTYEYVRTEQQLTPFDDGNKDLMESAFITRQRLYRPDKLGDALNIEDVVIGSTTGIVEFLVGKNRFISLTVSFTIKIKEDFL